jgi:hypothetical protein
MFMALACASAPSWRWDRPSAGLRRLDGVDFLSEGLRFHVCEERQRAHKIIRAFPRQP